MFREGLRLVAVEQCCQPVKMSDVQRLIRTDGESDAVNRQRIVVANAAQIMMKRAAGDQIVFSVNLEETKIRAGRQDLGEVLGFETKARPVGQAVARLRVRGAGY